MKNYLLWKPLRHPEKIVFQMLFTNNFITSSVMMYNLYEKSILFSDLYPLAEDFYLWHEYLHLGKVTNLNKVLIRYRINKNGATQSGQALMDTCKLQIILEVLKKKGITLNNQQEKIHADLVFNHPNSSKDTILLYFKDLLNHFKNNASLKEVLLDRYTKNQIRLENPSSSAIHWLLKVSLLCSFRYNSASLARGFLILFQSFIHKKLLKTA